MALVFRYCSGLLDFFKNLGRPLPFPSPSPPFSSSGLTLDLSEDFFFGSLSSFVGEVFELDHVPCPVGDEEKISLQVLSTNPRIFDVSNLLSNDESQEIIDAANEETREALAFHQSETGITSAVSSTRTSDSAEVSQGPLAQRIKRYARLSCGC